MGKKGTIVLIHGFLGSFRTWEKMRFYLLWKGYNVKSPTLPSELKTTNPDAGKAADYVYRYLSFRKVENPLILVGHSFGGLIAKQFYLKFREEYDIPAIITLSTPHRGVRWGRKIMSFIMENIDLPPGKTIPWINKETLMNLNRTFSYDSPVIGKLNKAFYGDIKFLLIGATIDSPRHLTPVGDGVVELDSQIPPFVKRLPNVRYRIFHGVNHMNIQKIPQTRDLIYRFIGEIMD